VGDVASEREALGYLVVLLGLGRRYYGARDLGVGEEVVVEVELEGNDAQGAILLEVAQLRAPGGAICLPFRLSMSDVACGAKLTVVHHLRAQHQAFAALLRPLRIDVGSDWVDAVVGQRVAARGELFAASRDVFGAEDAGSRRQDRLLEEAAIQHLHGAVRRRGEHVVSGH
jgi:hypothetical protein